MVGIVSNSAALFAQRNLATASSTSESSIARLSSGNAIVSAADDVAGLAIGTVLRTTVSTLKTIISSVSQATSLLGIADAGLQNIGEILQRQKSLAVQANTGSLSNNERAFLDQEFQSLVSEIDRIVTNTTFNGIALLDGSIAANATAITTTPGTDTPTFTVSGTVGTGALVTGQTAASIAFSSAANNQNIAGSLSDIQLSAVKLAADNTIGLTLILDGEVYTDSSLTIAAAADIVLTHTGGTATVTIDLTGAPTGAGISDQTTADSWAAALETALAGLTVYQSRVLTDADIAPATGTLLVGASGNDFTLRSITAGDDLDTPSISNFSVVHEETGVSDGQISVTINGNVYRTTSAYFSDAADMNDANQGDGAGIIRLYRGGDDTAYANEFFELDLSNVTSNSVNMNTEASAEALQDALNELFGSGGSLTFQVGTTAADSISLSLDGAATTSIYLDDDGVYAAQSVATSDDAQTASDVLDNAINTVTSLRATIGALQSRFNFAASSVNASIQNTEAARAIFLDVDIAEESTKFATAQVRLQASISVLAQANLIPQNLLKLIG